LGSYVVFQEIYWFENKNGKLLKKKKKQKSNHNMGRGGGGHR